MKKLYVYLVIILGILVAGSGYSQTTFGPQQVIAQLEVNNPTEVYSADINSDGLLDIIVVHSDWSLVSWFKNDGNNSFQRAQVLVEGFLAGIIVTDVDGDDDVDFLGFDGNQVKWFLNNGNGSFGIPQTINLPNTIRDIKYSDFDLDGDNDILLAINNQLVWLSNNGEGVFGSAQPMVDVQPTYAGSVDVADVNNDALPDIVAGFEGGRLVWYANDGSGNFGPKQLIGDPLYQPSYIATADLDSDGDNDILIHYGTLQDFENPTLRLAWLPNDGSNNFGPVQDIFAPSYGYGMGGGEASNFYSIQLLDYDYDGDLDIVSTLGLSNWEENSVLLNITYNNGIGQFTTSSNLQEYCTSLYLNAVDLNSDGLWDIVNSKSREDYVGIRFDGFPEIPLTYTSCSYIQNIYPVYLNDDNLIDFVTINYDVDMILGYLTYYTQTETGDFITLKIQHPDCAGFFYLSPMIVLYIGKFDNDDFIDLITLDFDGQVKLYRGFVYTSGYYYVDDAVPLEITFSNNTYDIRFSDLNNDGAIDIVSVDETELFFSVFLNNGDGNFDNFYSFYSFDYSNWLIEDFDNNGLKDIGVISGNLLIWHVNTGEDFQLLPEISLPVSDSISNTSNNEDFNGDGFSDFFLSQDSQFLWLPANGTGSFGTPQVIGEADMSNVQLVDMDLDGDMDLIGLLASNIVFFENLGYGIFSPIQQMITDIPINTMSMKMVDMDGDFDLDVVIASTNYFSIPFESSIVWYENMSDNQQISGTVFYDNNQNGLLDEDDFGLNFQNITLTPNVVNTYSNSNGGFTFVTPNAGEYNLTFNLPEGWAATSPTTLSVSVSTVQGSSDNNFGIYPISPISDIQTYINSGLNRCSNSVPYYLTIANEGTAIEDMTIVAFQPDPLLTFSFAFLPPDSISTSGVIYWHVNNLLPNSNSLLTAYFQAPDFTNIGSYLQNSLSATCYNNTGNPTDTATYTYTPIVVCAYDPNDKTVTPEGIWEQNYTLVDEELFYTIRFQNTGNDTAFYVRITDVLSPHLDHSTFRIVNSSHDMQTYRYPDGLVEFHFHDIMLPDSTTNEPGSHGFVMFAVKPLPSLSDNTPVNNTADIYFDQNPPIITNTTLNTLVYELPASPPLPITLTRFTGTVQPQDNLLQWTTAAEVNNAYFTLQYSPNGNEFTSLAQIAGAGTASAAKSYQYTHANPYPLTYYRLLQTDYDGTTRQAGEVITLNRTQSVAGLGITHILPNPTRNSATLIYTSPQTQPVTLILYDLTGRLLHEATIQATIGTNNCVLDMLPYPQGLYVVTLNNGVEVVSGKVVKE
ncbi:MAG: VCBS repeat-containing protein [Sphingobacteriales bacterium]|nr:MAG: VCBS repeat-containing protein [Sphingobacteriales bacterium]